MEAGNLQGGGVPIPPSTPSSAYGSGLVGGCGGCPNLSGQDLRYPAGNLAQSQMPFQNVP